MIYSAHRLIGSTLHAKDASFGHCGDFYLDDQCRRMLYLVADTGDWLSGRKTLLTPQALGSIDDEGSYGEIPVDLTRKEIEDSPPIDEAAIVSRHDEERLHMHYDWAPYWMDGFYAATPTRSVIEQEMIACDAADVKPHLLSAKVMFGYSCQGEDGRIGRLSDILLDSETWQAVYLVVDLHPLLPSGLRIVPMEKVLDMSHLNRSLRLDATIACIEEMPTVELYRNRLTKGDEALLREGAKRELAEV